MLFEYYMFTEVWTITVDASYVWLAIWKTAH
jgi:hypothetical protein